MASQHLPIWEKSEILNILVSKLIPGRSSDWYVTTKGQLISKGNVSVFNSFS